jgi:tetratricopeptide (TPR) repeat protein
MEESLALYRELGDAFCEARVLDDIAFAYWYSDPAKRVAYSEKSLAIRRRIGDEIGQSAVLLNLAVGYFWTGDYKTGMAADLEALDIAYHMGDRYNIGWHSDLLTMYHIFTGEFDMADEYLTTAEHLSAEIDDPDLTTQVKLNRSILMSLQDEDYEGARRLADEAYPLSEEMSMHQPGALLAHAIAAVGLGDYSRLPNFLHLVVEFEKTTVGGGYDFAWYAPIIAALALSRGETVTAAEIMGFYDKNVPGVAWTGLWLFVTRLRDEIIAAIGSDEYNAAYDRGKTANIDLLFSVATN